MSGVSSNGPNPSDPSSGAPYKPQYQLSAETKKFWQQLFHGTDLTDKQLSQMNDQFIRMVGDEMNRVLKWALEKQKERNRESKENS